MVEKALPDFPDTLTIDRKAVIFYTADSLQLVKIKNAIPPDEYETNQHTCLYMGRNARAVLHKEWSYIPVIEVLRYRYLRFLKADKSVVIVDPGSRDMCGLFLFDGEKDPEPADMMNIDTALRFYFTN